MKLNLQDDAQKIRRYIEKRIRDYPIYLNLGPGEDTDPIRLITLGYYVAQTGYFALVFDTRSDADNDGEWTGHIENDSNVVHFPKWCAAFERISDGGDVEVTMLDGVVWPLDSDEVDFIAIILGEMLRDIMCELRDGGAFEKLPLARKAFFVIEEFDGNWGWPDYAKRKTLGRLRKKP